MAESKDSRRRSTRHRLRGAAVVVKVQKHSIWPTVYRIRLRNVSRHGVAFLSRAPMMPGDFLRIELPIGPRSNMVEKHAIVRRCRYVEDMIHEVGAEFCAPKADNK